MSSCGLPKYSWAQPSPQLNIYIKKFTGNVAFQCVKVVLIFVIYSLYCTTSVFFFYIYHVLYLFVTNKYRLGSFYTVAPREVIRTTTSSSSEVEKNAILAKMEYHKVCSSLFCIKVVTLQNPQAYCRSLSRAYIRV